MKKIVFMFLFLLYLWQNSFSQENNIWGVWNTGNRETCNVTTITNKDGSFLRSMNTFNLNFQADYYGNGPLISEQGYSYEIKKIIENEGNIVSLYIETELQFLSHHPLVNAKIVIHFIDPDHMWMEVDRSDKQYPTDPLFGGNPFNQGRSVVFWRKRVG
jgi:hypothetical protein